QGLRFIARQAAGVLRRPPSRGQRVAGVDRHIHHAAALRAVFVPVRAFRIDVSLVIAVLFRVGVDDAADRAVFVRDLRFDSSPARAVAGDDYLALHVDAHLRQLLVIGGPPLIYVDPFPPYLP